MRIVGGQWGGRPLKSPKGHETRPTSDALRETLFNILEHGLKHDWGRCLDLFSGTGALGLEALSRGAKTVVFVESERAALESLKKNLSHFEIPPNNCWVYEDRDLKKWPFSFCKFPSEFLPFDTIFCDPPYEKSLIPRSFRELEKRPEIFSSQALLICETSRREDVPILAHWTKIDDRTAGSSRLLFYRRSTLSGDNVPPS